LSNDGKELLFVKGEHLYEADLDTNSLHLMAGERLNSASPVDAGGLMVSSFFNSPDEKKGFYDNFSPLIYQDISDGVALFQNGQEKSRFETAGYCMTPILAPALDKVFYIRSNKEKHVYIGSSPSVVPREWDVYENNLDGSSETRLTVISSAIIYDLVYSSRDNKLYFNALDNKTDKFSTFSLNLENSELKPLGVGPAQFDYGDRTIGIDVSDGSLLILDRVSRSEGKHILMKLTGSDELASVGSFNYNVLGIVAHNLVGLFGDLQMNRVGFLLTYEGNGQGTMPVRRLFFANLTTHSIAEAHPDFDHLRLFLVQVKP
jgi:hypothetical protein